MGANFTHAGGIETLWSSLVSLEEQAGDNGIWSACTTYADPDVTAHLPYQIASILEAAQDLRVQNSAIRIEDTQGLCARTEVPVQTIHCYLVHGSVSERKIDDKIGSAIPGGCDAIRGR